MFACLCRAGLIAGLLATPLAAEPQRIAERGAFLGLVEGRTLTRPLVRLRVTPDGGITGSGFGFDVSGDWSWEDGFFCRTLRWSGGGRDRNCQLVTAEEGRIRFTSDRGSGDSAGFAIE